MHNLPFNKPGRFYRGNIHTHSNRSDGALPPEEVCKRYYQEGYDFLVITDHFLEKFGYPITDTAPYQRDDFVTFPGAELHCGQTELGHTWHIVAAGLPMDFAPPVEGETGPQIARRALDAGAFVAAAHPHWYNLTESDVLSLGDIHAIETYNGACQYMDTADSWYMLDLLLARGKRYFACAADDAHMSASVMGFATGWVWVKSDSFDADSILDALKAGAYYSSTGPRIHDVEVYPGEKIVVRCSPASIVSMIGRNPINRRVMGHHINEAVLSLDNFDTPYVRIVVKDSYGNRAWTNPVFLD